MGFNKENIIAVILAGNHEFGLCPVRSKLNSALWPVAGKSVLERLLISLAKQGVRKAIICSNGDATLIQQSVCLDSNHNLNIEFLDEPLPVGTAGCIRDAADDDSRQLLLVLPACIVNPPIIEPLLQAHLSGKSDLTVALNPDPGNPAGIYICSRSLKNLIPKQGYFDIKEGLIPAMLSADKTINTVTVPNDVGNFHDWQQYLYEVSKYLQNAPDLNGHLTLERSEKTNVIYKADSANIEAGSRLYGHVVIMDNVHLPCDSVIFGPTVIGRNVKVGKNTTIVNSIIWDDVQIGDNCLIRQSVISRGVQVSPGSELTDQAVSIKQHKLLSDMTAKVVTASKKIFSPLMAKVMNNNKNTIDRRSGNQSLLPQKNFPVLLGIGLLLVAFIWSYWPGIMDLLGVWQRSDEYSSGMLVPFLTIYILWSRRDEFVGCQLKPSVWGIFAFLAAQGVRTFGLYFMYGSLIRFSLVLSVASLVLLLCGWQFCKRIWGVLLFLCLMLPWPNRIQAALALPLQKWASISAVFCLETIGYEVLREGNYIHIGNQTIGIAEACNGLRMITSFFVISGLITLLVKRAWWEKLIILLSSIPVALLCNTIRLTITSIAFTLIEGEDWEMLFHDFGGYAMMPLALGIIIFELWLLARLFVKPILVQEQIIRRL